MKDKSIQYLQINSLLHMGMLEAIHRNTADILYAETDGVLIKEQKSNAYMISVENFKKGQELLNSLSQCSLIVTHQKYLVDHILNKFGLSEKLECFQAVYMDKNKLQIDSELEIRQLKLEHTEVILEHYNKLSKNEIKELLKNGDLLGGYKNGTLVGFIGTHLEGSMGLLEIFPQYRRLGYGAVLESHMINSLLEKGLVPFAQIVVNNEKSLALQNKLGLEISKDSLYWIF